MVPVAGRMIVVRRLTDTQLMHMARYANLLQKDDIAIKQKLDAVEHMLTILHKMVVQPSDLEFLINQEEDGAIELKDLMNFISIFQEDAPEDEKPKVRRGRPPVKRA